jgi:dihydrofolate reductase
MSAEDKKIGLITAMSSMRGIGLNGEMPWKDPAELKHFRLATLGRVLIMGSRTVDSLIKLSERVKKVYTPQEQMVLPGRTIIVVSRKEYVRNYVRLGLYVERSLEAAIAKAWELNKDEEAQIYLAGGGQLYKEALEKDLIDTMLISHVAHKVPCDTFFPSFDPSDWSNEELLVAPTFVVELYTQRKDLNEPALYSS